MGDTTERYGDVDEDGGIGEYEPEFVDVDGVRTRYYDGGTGDPLVLVHGGNWSGLSSANTWTDTFEYLREEFRVVAFDRIGCGMTDNPEVVEDYRYETELRHALGFIETMGFDTCHIAGYSRGGGLATRMAVEDPDRFDSLTITNSATLGPQTGDADHRWERIFRMEEFGLDPTDPEYKRDYYRQYSHRTDYITDERCRTAAYLRSRPKALETARIMEENGRQEHWEETMRDHMNETHQRIKDGVLTMPTLYVFGRNDLTVPLEMSMSAFDMMAQHNPRVRMKVINECGHMIFLEHPREFSRTLVDFVDYWEGATSEG